MRRVIVTALVSPDFKCVLITDAQELESKQPPRTLAYKYFRVFFAVVYIILFIYFFYS